MNKCCSEVGSFRHYPDCGKNASYLMGIIVLPEYGTVKLYNDCITGSEDGVNKIMEMEKENPGTIIKIYAQLESTKSNALQSNTDNRIGNYKEANAIQYHEFENIEHDQSFHKFRSNPSYIPVSKLKTKSYSSVRKQNYIMNQREKQNPKRF